jgi:hypothetical protein
VLCDKRAFSAEKCENSGAARYRETAAKTARSVSRNSFRKSCEVASVAIGLSVRDVAWRLHKGGSN